MLRRCWIALVPLAMLGGCGRAPNSTAIANGAPGARPAEAGRAVEYCRDVAPVLIAHCAGCHRPGEVAPFSLLSYRDAKTRARQIAEVTRARFMPPWLPEPGNCKFVDDRRLSDSDVELLAAWAAAGAPEGDARDLPAAPKYTSGWQLGEPDLVLESPAFHLPADGADQFRNFVLTAPDGEAHWIRAVELRPENPRVTHHARVGLDVAGESMRRDTADDQPGYEGMAWGQDPAGQLITWTPGMLPDMGSTGAAWRLEPGARLVLHTHLQPSGKPEVVRFRVGLHYASSPPTVHPQILRIGSRDIDIPADEARHTVTDEYELPIDVDVHFLFPHAHKLCREIQLEAVQPDGGRRTLIAIRHFDEKWHDKYRLAEPVRFPRGTRLVTTFTYDNSTANMRNPHHPPRRVVYGSNADDEMSDVFLQVTPVDPSQYAVLKEHQDQAELRSKIVGYGKSLSMYPDDVWSLEGLASCYVASHQAAKAIALLEEHPQLLKKSTQAAVILGMAQLAVGDASSAEQTLRQAITADETTPLAWLGVGQALVAQVEGQQQEQIDSAERAFRRAFELAPQLIVARLDLVDLLVSQQRLDEAVAACQTAIELAPEEHLPRLKLANVYARQQRYDEALASFAAARERAPFVYSPQASLAIACYELGDESTANRLLAEAVALDARDPVPRFFLGQIARRNSAWDDARDNLQRALDLPTPRTWPASHVQQFLRLVYAEQLQLAVQIQDEEFARGVLRAWLQLEPDNAAVRKQVEELDAAPPLGPAK